MTKGIEIKVKYWSNGRIEDIRFIGGPTGAFCNPTGNPSWQIFNENGVETHREYHDGQGRYHRTDGPARQHWRNNGQLHWREYWVDGRKINPDNGEQPFFRSEGEGCLGVSEIYAVDDGLVTSDAYQKYRDTIEVTANGKTVRISKKSAKELNLL